MRARCLFVSLAVGGLAQAAGATPQLFATFRDGATFSNALYEVDPTTAATSWISQLPNRIWGDISGRTGDGGSIYGVSRLPGSDYQNQVSRIDTESGAVTDLYSFTASDLGFAPSLILELKGITFDPTDSSVALVQGLLIDLPLVSVSTILFDLDLDTGAVSGLQSLLPLNAATDPNYAPDGTLFTLLNDLEGLRLATIDLAADLLVPIGTCETAICGLWAMEIDPISGELYAVDAYEDLLVLSPTTGAVVETIGPTGLGGSNRSFTGLAFVVNPEPGTGSLLAVGLVLLAAGRRRRH